MLRFKLRSGVLCYGGHSEDSACCGSTLISRVDGDVSMNKSKGAGESDELVGRAKEGAPQQLQRGSCIHTIPMRLWREAQRTDALCLLSDTLELTITERTVTAPSFLGWTCQGDCLSKESPPRIEACRECGFGEKKNGVLRCEGPPPSDKGIPQTPHPRQLAFFCCP